MSKKQDIARKRNGLLFRLRIAEKVFNYIINDNNNFTKSEKYTAQMILNRISTIKKYFRKNTLRFTKNAEN